MGIQEQRSLVLLFHSRAILKSNEYQKVLIFIALPQKLKERNDDDFLDLTFCFHIITSTTIPCPKSAIETLEQVMQLG